MRVIAGLLKGRSLNAPRGSNTRPTADRVREAMFSMLGSMENLNVLDLYAGTGALGIEALSRGARQAVFVEASRHASDCIRRNLSDLTLEGRSHLLSRFVERAEHEMSRWAPYDLAFCDPPWSRIADAWKVLAGMNIAKLLTSGGRLVFEHPANSLVELGRWGQMDVASIRAWGDSAVTILKKITGNHNP